MRALERRDDALELGEVLESLKRLRVGGSDEPCAFRLLPCRELGSDAGVVEARRDRVGIRDLAVLVLEDVGADAVEDADLAAGKRGRMPEGVDSVATGFDSEELHGWVFGKRVEHPYAIRTTADTGNHRVGQFSPRSLKLILGFIADDGLKCADNSRERVRSDS